ncbi:MAG: hypothetical protein ACJ763_09725 [Bdellovibrionia bacterium]
MIATSEPCTLKLKTLQRNLAFLGMFLAFVFSLCAQAIPVDPTDLEKAIQARRIKVDEFKAVATEAQKRGLRVFLAGGLAASYGDFIKHQLLAEQGKMKIQPNRLEPLSINITLPEQDLDLVITRADGKPESVEEIKAFRTWLEKDIPKTYAGKGLWDVNGLKTAQERRLAWSGDPDFARQNNDSLSIGLIELTDPPAGESIIQEAHHIAKPEGSKSLFLEDLAGDHVHFLNSAHHADTTRAKAGTNPEILGAIRVLTKAFQFDKDIPKKDLIEVAKIIRDFDPTQVEAGSYVDTWLKTRSKRLVTHSYAPEITNTILDHLGLREKLIRLGQRSWDPSTISWWMNKSPLPTSAPTEIKNPLPAVTAGDLGISHVDHITDPEATRLMTWRYDGVPRVFISRENTPGETAAHGPGFYTNIIGSRTFNTKSDGAFVQMSVDPQAREGIDFRRIGANGEGVVWLNGAHLRVVHPQYNASGECKDFAQRLAINLAAAANQSAPSPQTKLANLKQNAAFAIFLTGFVGPLVMPLYDHYKQHAQSVLFDSFFHGTEAESDKAFKQLLKDQATPDFEDIRTLRKLVLSGNTLQATRSLRLLVNAPKHYATTETLIQILGESNPNLEPSDRTTIQQSIVQALRSRTLDGQNLNQLQIAILSLKDPSMVPYFIEVIQTLDESNSKRLLKVLTTDVANDSVRSAAAQLIGKDK